MIQLQKIKLCAKFELLVTSGGSRKFWWGGFEAKTSKIRMSSPKLRLIFKKKVLTKIETDFSAGFVTFRSVGGMHPEMEPNYSK